MATGYWLSWLFYLTLLHFGALGNFLKWQKLHCAVFFF